MPNKANTLLNITGYLGECFNEFDNRYRIWYYNTLKFFDPIFYTWY